MRMTRMTQIYTDQISNNPPYLRHPCAISSAQNVGLTGLVEPSRFGASDNLSRGDLWRLAPRKNC